MSEARAKWLHDLAGDVVGQVKSTPIRELVAEDLGEAGGRDMTAALVVSAIAHRHADGQLAGDIVRWMEEAHLLVPSARPLDVTMDAISMFRGGRLPIERWWEPALLANTFLETWSYAALACRERGWVKESLQTRWRVEDDSAAALSRGRPNPQPIEELAFECEALNQVVARLLQRPEADATAQSVMAGLPPTAEGNDELQAFARWIGIRLFIHGVLRTIESEPGGETPPGLAQFNDSLDKLAGEHMMSFTMVEIDMLSRPSKDDSLAREYISQKRYTVTGLSSGHTMIHGLPDRIGDETIVTDWLDDYVFSGGARSGIGAPGPTPYIWLALEPHELTAADGVPGIAIGLLPDSPYPVELHIGLGPQPDSLGMSFPAGHTDSTRRFLASLLLTGRLMIDIFAIDPEDGLILLRRVGQDVGTLVDALREPALDALRAHPLPDLLPDTIYDDHAMGGFAASENAKSELLLSLAESFTNEDQPLSQARESFLDAQVRRARTLHVGGDTTKAEQEVEDARVHLGEAWNRVRGMRRSQYGPDLDHDSHFRASVADLATDTRALVHYNRHNGRLAGFWTSAGGGERGYMTCSEIDTQAIVRAIEPWMQGTGDVPALIHASAALAIELRDTLVPLGIEEAVILPWAVLQGVPFGALPLDGGILADQLAISYAPSVGLLRVASGSTTRHDDMRRDAPALVAAHGEDLAWADAEVQAAALLHNSTAITNGCREDVLAAARTGRIVHIASHGQWWREDHFASVLDLRLPSVLDRYVSASDIHRDVALRGAELVLLSACDTGRSPSTRRYIENYTGLDAAFLAKGAKAVISTLWPVNDLAALLFMTWTHIRLLSGDSVAAAFSDSVRMLRGAGVDLLSNARASQTLDQVAPGWRKAREQCAALLAAPQTWATFKLSGAHWTATPIALDSASIA